MNFLALLGWSYDDKTTIMSRDELIERFSFDRVQSSPATFDYKKLDWMNGVYLRGAAAGRVRGRADRATSARAGTRRRCGGSRRSCRRSSRASASSRAARTSTSATTSSRRIRRCSTRTCSRGRARCSQRSTSWDSGAIEAALRELADELGLKPGQAFQPIRMAVTGSKVSPGSVREPRAARPRRDAQASASRGRRSGLGGPSGSSARWNCSHARLRKEAVGVGGDLRFVVAFAVNPRHSPPRSVFTACKGETRRVRCVTGGAGSTPRPCPSSVERDEQPEPEQRRDEHEHGADGDRARGEELRTACAGRTQARGAGAAPEPRPLEPYGARSARGTARRAIPTRAAPPRRRRRASSASAISAVSSRASASASRELLVHERRPRAAASSPSTSSAARWRSYWSAGQASRDPRGAGPDRRRARRAGRASARGRSRDRPSLPRTHAATRCRASASLAARS